MRPPKTQRAAGGGSERESGQRGQFEDTADPRIAQDMRVRRHAGQRPPRWPKPKGADGMAMLDRLFGPPRQMQRRRGGRS